VISVHALVEILFSSLLEHGFHRPVHTLAEERSGIPSQELGRKSLDLFTPLRDSRLGRFTWGSKRSTELWSMMDGKPDVLGAD
jgi:hypothetical protein